MSYYRTIQEYSEMLGEKTGVLRHDVELIKHQLGEVDEALHSIFVDEEKIMHKIDHLCYDHKSFNERLQQVTDRLNKVKSILATRHS